MLEFKSAMFVPGANEKMLSKASSLEADLILLDLEDSVRQSQKEVARELVANTLIESRLAEKTLGVRVNALDSHYLIDDLRAVLVAKPDLVLLPKVVSGDDLTEVDGLISKIEADAGMDVGSTKLIILTAETPGSLLRFDSLVNVSNRLVGMTWGPEDLASELGASRSRNQAGNWLPPFQLAQTLCLAKACDLGIQALDTVMADFKDLDGLRRECMAAKEIGFTGKLAIHPSQLAIINEVFKPTEQEIEFAHRVIELFKSNNQAGALQLDGIMLDIPHLRAAERLLRRI